MRKHWYSIRYLKFDINSLLLENITSKLSEQLSNKSLKMSANNYITNSELVEWLHSNFERLCIVLISNYNNVYKQEVLPNSIVSVIKSTKNSNIKKLYYKKHTKRVLQLLEKELKNIDRSQQSFVVSIRGQ